METKLICIIGPDGAGKTTQAQLLVKRLKEKEIKCEYKWLRFNHFFSLPLLALARLIGLSEITILNNGKKIGYHYFYRSKTISLLYPMILFIDMLIFTLIKIFIPIKVYKKTIVCDRFIYDTIVDLMVATRNYDLYNTNIGKLFLSLVPKNSKAIMLITDEKTLRKRREDLMQDKTLNLRINLYKKLAQHLHIPMVDASLPIEKIQVHLLKMLNLRG